MLTRLVIENFKSIRHADFFVKPLTVMAGINSSGKSSIIQAIRLTSNCDLEQHGDFEDLRCRYAEAGQNIRIGVAVDNSDLSYWSNRLDSSDSKCTLYQISSAQYISADRLGPKVSYYAPKNTIPDSVGKHGEDIIPYCAYHKDDILKDCRRHSNVPLVDTLDYHLEAWMQEICPGIRLQFWQDANIDTGALRVGVNGDQTVLQRPTNVGFGLSYTLPVVATLLGASIGDLILIENPESHLHPIGQTKIGELLARTAQAGVQVFIETHSDHLIDGIRIAVRDCVLSKENVTVLFCEKSIETNISAVKEISIKQNGDMDSWPPGFCDQSLKNLSKLTDFS